MNHEDFLRGMLAGSSPRLAINVLVPEVFTRPHRTCAHSRVGEILTFASQRFFYGPLYEISAITCCSMNAGDGNA